MRHFWSQYILGGTEVEDFSQFPYALSMRYVEIHVCGASIIANNWVRFRKQLLGDLINIMTIFITVEQALSAGRILSLM